MAILSFLEILHQIIICMSNWIKILNMSADFLCDQRSYCL